MFYTQLAVGSLFSRIPSLVRNVASVVFVQKFTDPINEANRLKDTASHLKDQALELEPGGRHHSRAHD